MGLKCTNTMQEQLLFLRSLEIEEAHTDAHRWAGIRSTGLILSCLTRI